ncbi:MAG: hypothetical protein EPN22_03930 [Nitrospirae bacterium]|nr:MAG: hypothetical protein EPN22_03930 [Nitrospirota bacterium]
MQGKCKVFLDIIVAALFSFLAFLPGAGAEEKPAEALKDNIPKFFAPKPPSSENFPCSKCHQFRATNKTKRKLHEYHTAVELKHAEEQRWCYDCHEGNKLRLQNGQLINFDKSYQLCGQCHGTIFRDWKAGLHGKRTGSWDGEKLYRLCVSCHDPHKPKYRPIEPKQQPLKPADIK